MQALAAISPNDIFRNGVKGSIYVPGERASRTHKVWVLSQFPMVYTSYPRHEESVVETIQHATQVKKLEDLQALIIYVTPQNLDIIEPLIAVPRTRITWLIAMPASAAVARLRDGSAGSRILTVDRNFAPQALGLMVSHWQERAEIIVPDGVKQIYPMLPSLPKVPEPVASLR